jgi:hypothetical protein
VSASAWTGFRLLAGEALRDALRRRIVLSIVAVSLLSLLCIDACSTCAPGSVVLNGTPVEAGRVEAVVGAFMLVTLALWIPLLAGVLAADPLGRMLDEGGAALWLARPVSRESFALAQLAGVLGIALATGAVLLGSAIALLALRQGLAPGPALMAGCVVAQNAASVASLAMLASLWLPRAVVTLAVVGGVGALGGLELLGLARFELGGLAGLVAGAGPPLVKGPVLLLAAWAPGIPLGPPGGVLLRAGLWPLLGTLALCAAFRRLELRG